jgi:hypothetical protein
MLRLIDPTIELEESHKTFLEEFQKRDERLHPWSVAEPFDKFSAYIEMLYNASKGLGLA